MLRIGPAGNSVTFYESGRKHTHQAPEWLKELGLNAFEYSFGRGVSLSNATAKVIGEQMAQYGIAISAHAPYYINLAGTDEGAQKSYGYIKSSLAAVKAMGGNRLVVHVGSVGKQERNQALSLCAERLSAICDFLADEGIEDYYLCLETMGKYSQIGNVPEILELCKLSPQLLPCFDFGHINALMQGGLKTADDYAKIFDSCFSALGDFKTKNAHIHFSKLEYGKSGEIRHLDFSDTQFGPNFEPLAEVILKLGLTPTIICESRDFMSDDAITMKKMLEEARGKA